MDLTVFTVAILAAIVIYTMATVFVYFTGPKLPFLVAFGFLTVIFCVYADDITTHFGVDSEVWAHLSEWGGKLKTLPTDTVKKCLLSAARLLDLIENGVWKLCSFMDLTNVTRWRPADVEEKNGSKLIS